MRQLYVFKILQIITYGYPAWFFDYQGTIRQGHILRPLIKKLERLCKANLLAEISGAMNKTSRILLRKELHVCLLSQLLQMKVIAHQANIYDTEHAKELRLVTQRASLGADTLKSQPFTQLDIYWQKS